MERGLVHIYCGDGKGKTTAAFGLAFRCVGRGNKVLVLQFLKGGVTGEVLLAQRIPEIYIIRGNAAGKFSFMMSEDEKAAVRSEHDKNLAKASALVSNGQYSMIVLDEIMAAWEQNLIDRKAVLELIVNRTEGLEVVMTGRNPPKELLDLADYVSEIRKLRHPFDTGVSAREGIEL